MVGDASDGPTVEKMVATAMQRFGRLDGLFCNAGISGGTAPVTEYPEEMSEKVLRINLWSVFLGMRHAIPALRATGGGSIVSTSSSAALKGSLNISAYTASKHAVLGLTRSVALEVAKDGIRVNTIAPGPTETPMFLGHKKDPHAAAASMSPMGRMAQAEEQAEVARWLLLDAPPYLTGTVIPVDGGLTAK
jgi:NAD(P)-dependent dehydrogenase (short-subunit alcohol dehydrogenase family)